MVLIYSTLFLFWLGLLHDTVVSDLASFFIDLPLTLGLGSYRKFAFLKGPTCPLGGSSYHVCVSNWSSRCLVKYQKIPHSDALKCLFEKRPAETSLSKRCFNPGNFWHITDLHLDPTYDQSKSPEVVCASSGKQPAANAGQFGDYVCDSPWHLINSSVYAMKDILPDPDFIVWTGYVRHVESLVNLQRGKYLNPAAF